MGNDPNTRPVDQLNSSATQRANGERSGVAENAVPCDEFTQNGSVPIQHLCAKLLEVRDEGKKRVEDLALAIRERRYSISAEQIAGSILSKMSSAYLSDQTKKTISNFGFVTKPDLGS